MKKAKKKIAFVLTTFVVGGVEKTFLDMLDCIDQNEYDITVFLPDNYGEWTALLQKKCRVKYLKIEGFKTVFCGQIVQLQLFAAFRSLFFRILSRLNYKNNYRKSTEYFIRSMPRVKERFDCVVAYQIINDECMLGSLYRLKAPVKVVWSHAYINKQEAIYGQWYNKFDKLFCVSRFAKKALIDNFPFLADKTEVFYNVINPKEILRLADESMDLQFSNAYISIVTVGRLTSDKGQDIIPHTARLLVDAGYPIKWYLVGDGDLRETLVNSISENKVQDTVILLGNKNNPYPYMKKCDIYVQTSVLEGWGLTVSEAKILHKPIVSTDAGALAEQIENGVNGILVEKQNPEKLASGIKQLIENPELREFFFRQLQREDVCHTGELRKLYQLMER